MPRKKKTIAITTISEDASLESHLKSNQHKLDHQVLARMFTRVDQDRVIALAGMLTRYISQNLPDAIEKRQGLATYRVNPYVLFTCAKVMGMSAFDRLATFIFDTKLYMGLETSFGKQIEAAFVGQYPLNDDVVTRWISPPEKDAEADGLRGLARTEKAKRRTDSVWREIDRSCVVGDRRFLVSIKSGPNCINDTQVSGMVSAFDKNLTKWMESSRKTYRAVKQMDVVIGITYGTDRTTNNKENQFLIKLLDKGFEQEDPKGKPGVLIDSATRSIRVYRRIGQDFWAMVGNPISPDAAAHVFLEILLALTRSLSSVVENADLETKINLRIRALMGAFERLLFPRETFPTWVSESFTATDMFLFATALGSFYDEGI